jgi:4-amino-4-deoxy-L-arabinose transferase-like glycosyltransferase
MSKGIRGHFGVSGILLAAVLLRCGMLLAWFFTGASPGAFEHPDTHTYLGPAQSLIDQGKLLRGNEPEIVRGPGYPLLLALGQSLGHLETTTIAVQIFLSAASVYLVYRLALHVTARSKAALASAWLYAIEPLSVMYCGFLLSETLFTFLLLAFALCLLHFARTAQSHALILAAMLLAGSTFVRPVSYFLPVVVAAAIVAIGPKVCWPRRLVYACVFLATCTAPLAAWQVRNARSAGYSGFSAITDQNLYFYQAAAMLAAREGKSLETKQAEMGALDDDLFYEQHPEWRGLSTAERYRQMGASARAIIRSDIPLYARIHLTAIGKLLVTPGAGDLLKLLNNFGQIGEGTKNASTGPGRLGPTLQRRLAQATLGALLAALLGLAAVGLRFAAGPVAEMRLLLVIAGYLLVVSGVPDPPARLRHPLMPIVCIFAGAGLAAVAQRAKRTPGSTSSRPTASQLHADRSGDLRRAG